MVQIPELDLELSHGTLGGIYTTVEGLLNKVRNSLKENNPFSIGDSSTNHHSNITAISETKEKFLTFLSSLEKMAKGEILPFTLILRDPLANSFISAPLGSFLPPESDFNLTLTEFERSYEENEEFGLNDMNTMDFETGVDYSLPEPAKINHARRPMVDHPSFFAKGVEDATPGGAFIAQEPKARNGKEGEKESEKEKEEGKEGEKGEWYSQATLPLGWVALKPEELHAVAEDEGEAVSFGERATQRQFAASDLQLRFDAREEFAGKRAGFVYRLGAQGVGYYEDWRGKTLAANNLVVTAN